MTSIDDHVTEVIVWFEDTVEGHAALLSARAMADDPDARLTVLTVATRERVIGCGRCLSGTVLWNLEMKKIAHEELVEAHCLLADEHDVDYQVVVGDPAQAIAEAARSHGADLIVLPWQPAGRRTPRRKRHLRAQLERSGSWRVVNGPPRLEPSESQLS